MTQRVRTQDLGAAWYGEPCPSIPSPTQRPREWRVYVSPSQERCPWVCTGQHFLVLNHQLKWASSDLFSINDEQSPSLWNPFPCRWASGGCKEEGDQPWVWKVKTCFGRSLPENPPFLLHWLSYGRAMEMLVSQRLLPTIRAHMRQN